MRCALIIGNSDGIGLALTRRLLAADWHVAGISRSPFPEAPERYHHQRVDIRSTAFADALERACDGLGTIDLCVYCAGVGWELALDDLPGERAVFEVNLLGAVTAIECVLPRMLGAGSGHFIGISSQADQIRDPCAPSYAASKAGLSAYLESLAKPASERGVSITNIRFGFVDTKMARSEVRPFVISADKAARVIEHCMRKRPRRYTHPKRMAVLLFFVRLFG